MSIREQERRQRETERRINKVVSEADRKVGGRIEQRAQAADHRAREVVRRIEKGDVQPRALPGEREDSMESMKSMESMESAASMRSMESAEYSSAASEESDAGMMEEMPLQDVMPYGPEQAEEDLAQRVTEETGSGKDPHAHNERKADEMAKQITADTGAEGDLGLHAERKVDDMGRELF